MDGNEVIFLLNVIGVLIPLISRRQPPEPPSLSKVIERIKLQEYPNNTNTEEQHRTATSETDYMVDREKVAIGCLPCAKAHFATVAGTLKEAIRFARDSGMTDPEVITRLQTASEDITIIERHDWTPEKILNSPPEQQQIIRSMLPKLRELRQDIMEASTVEDLEKSAARAAQLSIELRLADLKIRNPQAAEKVVELSQKVENGEMTMEEAKEKVRKAVKV